MMTAQLVIHRRFTGQQHCRGISTDPQQQDKYDLTTQPCIADPQHSTSRHGTAQHSTAQHDNAAADTMHSPVPGEAGSGFVL